LEQLYLLWKPQLTQFLVVNGAYYAGISFLLWLVFVFYFQGREILACLKRDWPGLLGSFVLAGVVFSIAHVGFRIFSDEASLLSVSENIAHGMKALNNIQGYFALNGDFVSIAHRVPTRPLMFPFLTACLHWILGVQPRNAIILNFVFLVLLFFTSFVLLKDKKIWLRALLVVALAFNASLALHAPTGGFDLCSLCFGLWTFMALWNYLQRPGSGTLIILILTSICFVQVRYESLMILPFLLVAVVAYRRNQILADLHGQWLLLFLPFLLLPSLIQRVVTWGEFENSAKMEAFDLSFILGHLNEFMRVFFLEWDSAYPFLFNLLGVVGLGFLFKRARAKNEKIFLGFSLAYGISLLFLLLAHFMGMAETPTQIRIFMPLSVLLFFAMAFGLSASKWKNILVAVCCVIQAALGFEYIRRDVPRESLSIAFENEELINLIKEHHLDKALFLYRRPNHLVAFGYSSVLPVYFQHNEEAIKTLVKDHVVSSLYDIEAVLLKKPGPLPEIPGWKRELKYDLPVTSDFKLQIFELVVQ